MPPAKRSMRSARPARVMPGWPTRSAGALFGVAALSTASARLPLPCDDIGGQRFEARPPHRLDIGGKGCFGKTAATGGEQALQRLQARADRSTASRKDAGCRGTACRARRRRGRASAGRAASGRGCAWHRRHKGSRRSVSISVTEKRVARTASGGFGCGPLGAKSDFCAGVERARPAEQFVAARAQRCRMVRADEGEEALQPARRHRRRVAGACRARSAPLARRPSPSGNHARPGRCAVPAASRSMPVFISRDMKRSASALARPAAFVEPADDQRVDALQTRFERAPDGDVPSVPCAGLTVSGRDQRGHHVRPFVGGEGERCSTRRPAQRSTSASFAPASPA